MFSCNNIPAHECDGDTIVTTEATCTTEGAAIVNCKICKKTVNLEPTCTQDGSKSRKCWYCDETETETIPASHSYKDGICSVCKDGIIKVVLPSTPKIVGGYREKTVDLIYNPTTGSLFEVKETVSYTVTISSIEVTAIRTSTNESPYYKNGITISYSGTKNDDEIGSVSFYYKFRDSDGNVIAYDEEYIYSRQSGVKFSQTIFIEGDFDTNKTYTLTFYDYEDY